MEDYVSPNCVSISGVFRVLHLGHAFFFVCASSRQRSLVRCPSAFSLRKGGIVVVGGWSSLVADFRSTFDGHFVEKLRSATWGISCLRFAGKRKQDTVA